MFFILFFSYLINNFDRAPQPQRSTTRFPAPLLVITTLWHTNPAEANTASPQPAPKHAGHSIKRCIDQLTTDDDAAGSGGGTPKAKTSRHHHNIIKASNKPATTPQQIPQVQHPPLLLNHHNNIIYSHLETTDNSSSKFCVSTSNLVVAMI